MLNFNDYLELAKKNQDLGSTRQLAKMINITSSALHQFANNKAPIKEETMLKIATLAGISQEKALIDFNLWKTQGKKSHNVWLEIYKKLCLLPVLFAFFAPQTPAIANPKQEKNMLSNYYAYYILCDNFVVIICFLKKLMSRVKNIMRHSLLESGLNLTNYKKMSYPT